MITRLQQQVEQMQAAIPALIQAELQKALAAAQPAPALPAPKPTIEEEIIALLIQPRYSQGLLWKPITAHVHRQPRTVKRALREMVDAGQLSKRIGIRSSIWFFHPQFADEQPKIDPLPVDITGKPLTAAEVLAQRRDVYGGLREPILRLLAVFPLGLRYKEVADRLGRRDADVRQTLRRLVEEDKSVLMNNAGRSIFYVLRHKFALVK